MVSKRLCPEKSRSRRGAAQGKAFVLVLDDLAQFHLGLRRKITTGWLCEACSFNLLNQAFGRFVMMILHTVFVAHHFAIELVDQVIHGGIKIGM